MSPKTGRPPIDNPKVKLLQIRVDDETLSTLDECASQKETTRSEIVREGIRLVKQEVDKAKK